jgi:ATP-dependent helicase/nuclease subunit B
MHPLVGLHLDAVTLTSVDDLASRQGTVGKPVWGPKQLLRDLELRLGLNIPPSAEAVRVACFAARMTELAPHGRFYSQSFAVDALGTAAALLGLRDALVEANWCGQEIAEGGARLSAIAELEAMIAPTLPPGDVDRLVTAARALTAHPGRVYEALSLAEPVALWPSAFQRIFQSLSQRGTGVALHATHLPGAPPASDLGQVQAALRGECTAPPALHGDGSFVLLTAETSWEAAQATAAVLARWDASSTAVIREGDASALDHALMTAGLATQGVQGTSPWRTALQVLPLCLELAFEPKDPQRVLELLTLPAGPFAGAIGQRLARALTRSPGIGSPGWERVKAELEPAERERVADWLETPGAQALSGAPHTDLVQVVQRVRDWLVRRVADPKLGATVGVAIGQCDAYRQALAADGRATCTLVEARRLLECVGAAGVQAPVTPELAGRIPQVVEAVNLGLPRARVLWWSFNQRYSAGARLPWRRRELAALAAVGVVFPDPRLQLLQRAHDERRAALAATEQLILVAPRTRTGERLAPHALWDEIVARLGLAPSAQARVTLTTTELLSSSTALATALLQPTTGSWTETLTPLALPGGHAEWTADETPWPVAEIHSPSSLSALLGCPLQWGLQYRAGLRSEVLRLPAAHMLNGMLGHRLIEELHREGSLALPESELIAAAERLLDGLFVQEGAPLLQPGKASERSQVRHQLVGAVCVLARALQDSGLQLLAVEKELLVPWQDTQLTGRIDMLAGNTTGQRIVIDLKWGYGTYRDALKAGQALQLAAYTYALELSERLEAQQTAQSQGSAAPLQAAYFALQRAAFVGPADTTLLPVNRVPDSDLRETWQRVEQTVGLAQAQVDAGRFAVVGLARSLPLLDALGIEAEDQTVRFGLSRETACNYCNFDALCGRRWEQIGLDEQNA